jgi:hypothetical protein
MSIVSLIGDWVAASDASVKAEAARRAALTPRQRKIEDCLAWVMPRVALIVLVAGVLAFWGVFFYGLWALFT